MLKQCVNHLANYSSQKLHVGSQKSISRYRQVNSVNVGTFFLVPAAMDRLENKNTSRIPLGTTNNRVVDWLMADACGGKIIEAK